MPKGRLLGKGYQHDQIHNRICLIRHRKGITKKWRFRRSYELCKQVKTLS